MLGRTMTYNDWLYYLCWTVARRAARSSRGCSCAAARAGRCGRSATARSRRRRSGVHLPTYKTLAFGVSAFYAGVAGSLFALAITFVNPDSPDPVTLSIFLLVGVVVGGLGSLWPLVFGAAFIQFLPGRRAASSRRRPGRPAIVFGAALILVMFVLPNGVGGLVRRV